MSNTAQGSPDGPKKIYGRENINWQGPQRASSLSQEGINQARGDFSQGAQQYNLMDGVDHFFELGDPHSDNGWFIPGIHSHHDFIPRGLSSKQDVEDDLDPEKEGSTAWKMNQADDPWEKYDILTSSEVFEDVAQSVQVFREQHDESGKKFKDLQKGLEDSMIDGDGFADAHLLYETNQQGLDQWQNHLAAKQYREQYLNLVANTLKGVAEKDLESMYRDDDAIGLGSKVYSVGEFETGSRDWLEMRQDTAGGSDTGAINSNDIYSLAGQEKVWESKVKEISDDQVAQQLEAQKEANDAISRGNLMEDAIGSLYARSTGKNIVHNKSTWKSKTDKQHINLDFAEHDSSGNYLGPVEIKNVDDDSKWGAPSEGLLGVPSRYRIQALQQAYLTGASQATVVAFIGGTTLKAYSEPMSKELVAEAKKHSEKTNAFMDKAHAARKKYQETGEYTPFDSGKPTRVNKGIPKYATKTKSINKDKRKLMSEMAVIGGTTQEDIAQRFVDAMGTTDTKQWSQEKQAAAFTEVYKSLKPTGIFNGIDLETNGMHPMKGKIIEFGGISYDMDSGEETARLGKLYNPGKVSMQMQATGHQEVHGISPEMVSAQDELDDTRQKEILDYVASNGPLVAHNASFEKGWLRGHIKGYAEAEARGDISYVDTMKITSQTTNTKKNRLEDFVTHYVMAMLMHTELPMM